MWRMLHNRRKPLQYQTRVTDIITLAPGFPFKGFDAVAFGHMDLGHICLLHLDKALFRGHLISQPLTGKGVF